MGQMSLDRHRDERTSPAEPVPVTRNLGPPVQLRPVGLDELTATADLQTRRDRKYLVPRAIVGDLIAGVAPGARVLVIDGIHSFRYESVYFDTADLASYIAAARRRPNRFKVRTRAYLDSGDCLLEVKTRDSRGRNVKHRHPYATEHRGELTDGGRSFVAGIDQATAVVDQLRPTLTTTYRRTTLALGDMTARVTIDRDLTWHGAGQRVEIEDLALVETKTAGPPCAFDRELWRWHHRPMTISKYCTGLAALHPALPANKWNRVLRRYFRNPA